MVDELFCDMRITVNYYDTHTGFASSAVASLPVGYATDFNDTNTAQRVMPVQIWSTYVQWRHDVSVARALARPQKLRKFPLMTAESWAAGNQMRSIG
jgi:hypothetical protein